MNTLDQKILDIIQTDFPLDPKPYALIAEQVGATEEEVFKQVCELRHSGVIRQLSANFWANKLGYVSTLCGAKVPEDKLEAFIAMVNECSAVTHNYLREHPYNVWFTLICESKAAAQDILDEFKRQSGVEILNLPATKIYKIKVNFKMHEDKNS